ncbi:MAG: family 16 glycosylhydrolase [Tepidisphaeraceae bacterium]|jgi:beta-glucanase (GH16 family)
MTSKPKQIFEALEPRLLLSALFSDDFNGTVGAGPSSAWTAFETSDPNNPAVHYTNTTAAQASASDPATLQIVSDAQANDGKALAMTLLPDPSGNGTYDSAEICTEVDPAGSSLEYGHIEARIKLPGGPNSGAIWPAFWILGDNISTINWPACGEVDIMENKGTESGTNHSTLHGPMSDGSDFNGGAGVSAAYTLSGNQNFYSNYHVFAMDWKPNSITFSVDGTVFRTFTPADLPAGGSWVFNGHPFFIILDVCEGAPFAPGTITSPQTMYVDYVHVTAPQVMNVTVDGTAWSSGFLSYLGSLNAANVGGYSIPTGSAQLKTLPWSNLNQINIVFSQNVNVTQSSLQLVGLNVPSYTFSNFSYNSATDTASWTLNAPIGDDKLLIDLSGSVANTSGTALDGSWTDGVSSYPSGNGTAGTPFMFSLNVLPGDENQSGGVNVLDTVAVAHLQGSSTSTPATYSIFADVNGSGGINVLDTLATNSRQGSVLPAGSPIVPSSSGVAATAAALLTASSGQAQQFSTVPIAADSLLKRERFGVRGVLAST